MTPPSQGWRTALWHLRKGGPSQLREWKRRRRIDALTPSTGAGASNRRAFNPMDMPVYAPVDRKKPFGVLRVAVIMDDFSLAAWGAEFDTVAVHPESWRSEVSGGIDLLFVESAWNGNGSWQYQLTGSNAPSSTLTGLVTYCREHNIPTVFWNKEDPPHFDDFLNTAKIFDVVFTSDSNMIPNYREALGHDRVNAMSFAAQPALHNPIRIPALHQLGDIAFAGMYFAHKYPERRSQMDLLLNAARAVSHRMDRGLDIYSRFSGGDARYQFPAPFDERVVGSLPYERMLSAYRAFKVFLNVNSVVESPSMCARRVFEITASGTPVVTTPSAAIPEFFDGNEVPVVHEQREAEFVLRALVRSPLLRDRMVHLAQRRIWDHHTYTHRSVQLLEAAGLDPDRSAIAPAFVTAMVSTNRPHQVDHVLDTVAAQDGVRLQLALLAHDFDLDEDRLRGRAAELGIDDLILLRGGAELALGDCLNRLVAAADGDVLAKLDDDDIYGPHYLHDSVNALRYSGADLVGKQASHLYLASQDVTVLRNPDREHRWSTFVAGPTFVGPRATFAQVGFESRTKGEDTAFLRALGDAGGRVYSADRFNFIQMRAASSVGHTWAVDDEEILANSDVVHFGFAPGHVIF